MGKQFWKGGEQSSGRVLTALGALLKEVVFELRTTSEK